MTCVAVLRYAAVPFDTPLLVPHSGTQDGACLTAATQETGFEHSLLRVSIISSSNVDTSSGNGALERLSPLIVP